MDSMIKANWMSHSKPETTDVAFDVEGDNTIRVYNCSPMVASLQLRFRGRFRSSKTNRATRAYRTRTDVHLSKEDILALIDNLNAAMEDM